MLKIEPKVSWQKPLARAGQCREQLSYLVCRLPVSTSLYKDVLFDNVSSLLVSVVFGMQKLQRLNEGHVAASSESSVPSGPNNVDNFKFSAPEIATR
jgi:hypothetical protein